MTSSSAYTHVSTEWVNSELQSGRRLTIIDVRTPDEYYSYHIPQAILRPLDILPAVCSEIASDEDIVFICEHGIRSEMAARYLAGRGYTHVATMDGGMAAYEGEVAYGE